MDRAMAHLRRLQDAAPKEVFGIPAAILEQRKRQFPDRAEIYERAGTLTIDELEIIQRMTLVEPLLSVIPETVRAQLEPITVGILPSFETNASAIRIDSGELLIVMHTELSALLSYYAELIVLSQVHRPEWLTPGWVALATQANAWMESVLREGKFTPYPAFPRDVPPERMRHVRAATFAMEAFVLAHEYAHVALGHLDTAPTEAWAWRPGSPNTRRLAWKREQESAADRLAMEWLVRIPQEVDHYELAFVALNRQAIFQIFELFALPLRGAEIGKARGAHPSVLERLNNCLSVGWPYFTGEEKVYAEMLRTKLEMRMQSEAPAGS